MASLKLENGVPVELRWDHRRWRVLDRPTRLGIRGDVYSPLVTHPPRVWTGWRFTARADDDGAYVFDVEVVSSSRCEVLYVYE
ncbi:hypothetical protein ACWIBQ_08025 [Microbacterium keratanolyticum]